MSEDLRHIVEQSFAAEETQAEKTPEAIRLETLQTIQAAKDFLEEVRVSQGEDSEFYKKALKEYNDIQDKTIKLLPETIETQELESLKREVSQVEKVSNHADMDTRVLYLLTENKDISQFETEDISYIEQFSEKYMRHIQSVETLLAIYNSPGFEKSNFPLSYRYLPEVIKNDKGVVQILLENFEDSGMNEYQRIDNLLTKEFKSDVGNIIFMMEKFPQGTEVHKNIFLSEYLQFNSTPETITVLAKNCKKMGILESQLRDMLPTEFIEKNMAFIGKELGPLDPEFMRRFEARKTNLENTLTIIESGEHTAEQLELLDTILRKEDLNKLPEIRDRVIQLCVSGEIVITSLKSIHNSSYMMGEIIRQTKGFEMLEFVSDEIRNNKFFLRKIAKTKKDFEEVLSYISKFVTNEDTILFLKSEANRLGVDIKTASPNLIGPDRSMVRKKWETQQKKEQEIGNKNEKKNTAGTTSGIKEITTNQENIRSLHLSPQEEKSLTPEEIQAISQSETVKENFLGFKAIMEELNLGDIWIYRNDIFKAIGGGNALAFNTQDGDYLSENEVKIFIGNVVYSIKDRLDTAEKNKVEQLKGGKLTLNETKSIVMQINRVGPIVGQENNGKLLNARSRVGGFFQEKFIDRDGATTFKMGDFQKALAS